LLLDVHLGAGHVRRQEVGRELDAAELAFEVLRQRLDRARLGQPGQPLHEDVPVGQHRDQHAVDDRLLADDAGLDALLQVEDGISSGHHATSRL
jgi:hypothetical protein